MNSRYEIVIFWSDDDERFVAEVPELPGCMADRTTYQDALAQAERAIEDWIETALDLGRQIPKPRRHIA